MTGVSVLEGNAREPSSASDAVRCQSGASIASVSVTSARERAMQAVEYYNSNVLHAQQQQQQSGRPPSGILETNYSGKSSGASRTPGRLNGVVVGSSPGRIRGRFGPANMRASYNERLIPRYPAQHNHHNSPQQQQQQRHLSQCRGNGELVLQDGSTPPSASASLYRSNSSLELDHEQECVDERHAGALRREYGSHGSIDVISASGESFFAMLRDYRPIDQDQRSPGPAKIAEYLRGKVDPPPTTENASNALANGSDSLEEASSPKLRLKFQKFWDKDKNTKVKAKQQHTTEPSLFRKLRGSSSKVDELQTTGKTTPEAASADMEGRLEERQRRRAFCHYDCQSITANLNYAAKLRGLLSKRRNTTTGASAASMGLRSATPDGSTENLGIDDSDSGDGRINDLVENCPYFRNEIGGEEERVVSLTRLTSQRRAGNKTPSPPQHKPALAYGVSVLETAPGETHWKHGMCPYQRQHRVIESVDQGALYYQKYFYRQEHQNWFGMDENLGPVAVSIKREKVEDTGGSENSQPQYIYRLIVRTSELLTLRGCVLEDAMPTVKSPGNKGINTKEVLEYVAPEISSTCLRLGVASQQTEEQLLKLDQQGLTNHYKVGVMYCKAGQSTEEEMYNNEEAGPAFNEFLETIGQRVRLKGFDKYKAGLDNKTDSTGLYSVYAQYDECEIMFHVSTLLPFTPNNRQQLLRKRHIGNDIVTIVFQEPGAHPFTPKNIRSQFQHVFIIVRATNPCSDNCHYSIAVSRSKEVPVFGPPIPEGASFPKSKAFADFLLAKVINAENAAHRSEKFVTMATRTRQEYLKDLATNYSTATLVETGQKFSMLSFSSKKKERTRPRFLPDSSQRGAISWQVLLDDSGQSMLVECYLGISADTIVLIEEISREIVFVAPCRSILGWHAQTNSLRIYHHQGECTTLHIQDGDRDELMEIVARLRAVTAGCPVQELSLRRNPMGQLGFHVQPDGVVTQVENMGLAWKAGLRQGARLVEICKVAVSTLTHDQMVDLLKTSVMVMVTVIPPLPDGAPRRGCTLQNCKYLISNYGGDYENLTSPEEMGKANHKSVAHQQQAMPENHRRRYERSLSPPRSSNSSGYGTGSSSKSFTGIDSRFPSNPEGTMTSSSSGHSSDDRWYELLEPPEVDNSVSMNPVHDSSPPPVPARLGASSGSAFHQVAPKRRSGEEQSPHSTSNHSKVNSHPHYGLSPNHGHVNPGYADYESMQQSAASQEFKVGEKVTCISDGRHLQHVDRALNFLRTGKSPDFNHQHEHIVCTKSASLPPDCVVRSEIARSMAVSDGHSTDTSSASERLLGARSEDELSAGSSNVSPRLRRPKRPGTVTPSSGSSRNQSPRTVTKDTGEARLRPGVTSRSANRNSANLNSSTLQEDLMKLINPDYLPEREDGTTGSKEKESPGKGVIMSKVHSNSAQEMSPRAAERSRSRENLSVGSSLATLSGDTSEHNTSSGSGEVIFTTARPATVISNASTDSSPAPSENKLSKEERLSPRVTKSPSATKLSLAPPLTPETLPLPDAREMDWPSLVDTATRAMLHVRDDTADSIPEAARNGERLGNWVDDVAERLGLDTSPGGSTPSGRRMHELESHMAQLESRVERETRRRLSLEDEVRRLRDENRRLQEESQAAAQQLRRFTEWFFQTIDRQ